MNELERAGTALRERPASATSLESIERRAAELTRRRRIGWTAVATALVVVAAVIGVGALRARSNDESIVVGPNPTSEESALTMRLNGVPDQATADEVATIVRDRIAQMNRQGVGISKDDTDPRVAIDMSEIEVTALHDQLTVTGPDEVLARLALAPALWGPGYPSMVTVRSDEGPAVGEVCPEGSSISIGVEPQCYVVGAESIDPRLDASFAQPTARPSGGLLVPWPPASEDLARSVADACSRPATGYGCPTGQVAVRVADGRVGVFTMSPATPPGMPSFDSAEPMSFDESFGWAVMLSRPLPVGVTIDPPPLPEFVMVATTLGVLPAGSRLLAGANVVFAPIERAFVPSLAITNPTQVNGRTAVVDIKDQAVIVEGMFE